MRIDRAIFADVARLKLVTPGVAVGTHQGDRSSPYVGRGVDFADYRPYQPGDDLRLVDWNVYSRLEAILVRLFHEDRTLSVQVCIDASASMGFGEPRKLDHAGALGAAIALVGLLNRDEVTLGCAGGAGPITIIRGQNQNAFVRILRYLELVEPAGVDNAARALKAQVRGGRPDRLFYVSDMLKSPEESDALLRRLSAVAGRPVLLHVLSEHELAPDLRHAQRVIDEETGEEVRIPGGRAAEHRYAQALAEYLEELEARCRALRIQYLRADTSLSVPTLLNGTMRRANVTQSASGASR
jgi:uncharacterized protein (DUF58 family)